MNFTSEQFLIFLPLVVLIHWIIPKKARNLWLLVTSYFFYMSWNAKYVFLLLFVTLITYLSGEVIGKLSENDEHVRWEKLKRLVVGITFGINVALLMFFKYFTFLFDALNSIILFFGGSLSEPSFSIIMPLGISFFMFQSLSYTVDVYRGHVEVEHNFLRYALFVSFFPQIVSGPIGRSKNMLPQYRQVRTFEYNKVKAGFLLMLWGFFMKLVIADRAAIFVNYVYENWAAYAFFEIVTATMLFAVQLYADFAGYSYIAMGASQMLGLDLGENFAQPYFAVSVQDFWRRWHISLSSWFRDYLYIPLGGNRKGKIRKYVNLMLTFLVSGLWHGANWNYVIWGGLNGLFQIIGAVMKPLNERIGKILHIKTDCESYRLFRILITFALINFTWLFFRAPSGNEAIAILKQMFSAFNPWVLTDGSLYRCGLSAYGMKVLICSIVVLFLVDLAHEHGVQLRAKLAEQNALFRYMVYFCAILILLYFGVYGPAFSASQFIYVQF